jgi:hypothetical protein
MAEDVDLRTAQTVARPVDLTEQSTQEIARLRQTMDLTTELIAGSRESVRESKKAMAQAMRVMW